MKINEITSKERDNLIEVPQIIDDLNNHDIHDIRLLCEKSLKNHTARKILEIGNHSNLFHLGDLNKGVYFSATNTGGIGYIAKYSSVMMDKSIVPSTKTTRQVLIKSFRGIETQSASTGVGKMIFWDYLFPQFGCMVSDSQQTNDGIAFWDYRIREAFEQNLIVRLADTNDKTYKDLSNYDELSELKSEIWGPSRWFQRIVIMILRGDE